MMPLVSVIIPTTDKGKNNLKKSLQALNNSTYKNLEIIPVNVGRERSYQRNFGIGKAKGEYILYLDDDQFVSPDLIRECVILCEGNYPDVVGYDALYIPEEITTRGFFGSLRNWERQFYTSTPIDCVRFIRRSECPLFDESLNGPEDSCHDRRVKGPRTTTRNVLYHEDNVTFWNFLKKKAYYSKSMGRYYQKYPNDKVLDWNWRCFGVFFENNKWKRFLSKPHFAFLIMGLIFLRGIIYVINR